MRPAVRSGPRGRVGARRAVPARCAGWTALTAGQYEAPVPERPLVPTLILSIAIVLAGFAVGSGVQRFRLADRTVTVKGVAERPVKADIALWPMRIVASGMELVPTQDKIAADERAVRRCLASHGTDSANVELQALEVTDKRSNPYEGAPSAARFAVSATIVARSDQPERIRAASQDVGRLVAAGVALSSGGGWGTGPTYLFTRLNELKPAMLAEATAGARAAAAEFAKSSGARVGGIRRAQQGLFEILPRDQAPGIPEKSQLEKVLRVVTTLEYELK